MMTITKKRKVLSKSLKARTTQ